MKTRLGSGGVSWQNEESSVRSSSGKSFIRRPSSVRQVARDIGVGSNLLFRWRRELKGGGQALPGSGVTRDQEWLTLKRELARVKRGRDFLRDAATFFARESR